MKKIVKYRGLIVTIIVSAVVLCVFYGKVLKNPNQVYFAANGDGLQNYYNHIYHVKFDSTYFRTKSMNYPYGEMIYYTGAQLIPVSILKFIDNHIVRISDYMIGIQNMMMLLSLIFASVFLYLIFRELKIPGLYSVLFAVAISFLSPQLDRFGGHFSLAYVFVVPLIFYLYMKFFQKPGLLLSLIIGLFAFWSFTTHPYFFGMIAVVWLFYWIYWFFLKKKKEISISKAVLYSFVQLLLPYLIVQLFAYLYDPVVDRTAHPYGFLVYRAFPEGIFLPFGKPYGTFLNSIFTSTKYIEWEGVAYVGLVGIIGSMLILITIGKKLIRKQFSGIPDITDSRILNIFFWASLAALLYAFGLPYILGLQWLVDYSGPLKQMRGIGRFAWVFFYLINIVSAYLIWKWATTPVKKIFLWALILMFCYDAYLNARFQQSAINNKVPELIDRDNLSPENDWVKHIHPEKYQAIIPIPYFDIGSENIWITSSCDDIGSAFIASLKTGLPSTGILFSRTSLSQSYKNLEVCLEPYRKLSVLKDYPNKKPLLLMVYSCDFKPGEQNLINHALLVFKGSKLSFYEMPFDTLDNLSRGMYQKTQDELAQKKLYKFGNLSYSRDTINFVYKSFDELSSSKAYIGKGAMEAKCDEYTTAYSDTLPNYQMNEEYIVSFWYGNILQDVSLRGIVFITYEDSQGKAYKETSYIISDGIKIIDGDWALCEFKFKLEHPHDQLRVTFRNFQLKRKQVLIDELIIKPEASDLYKLTDKGVVKNNRLYLKN